MVLFQYKKNWIKMYPFTKIGKILEIKNIVSPLASVKTVNVLATLPPKFINEVKKDKLPVDLFL